MPIMFQERNTARDTSADSQVLLEFDWLLLSSWGSLLYGTRATRLSLFSSYMSMYFIKNDVLLKILMIEVICFHSKLYKTKPMAPLGKTDPNFQYEK